MPYNYKEKQENSIKELESTLENIKLENFKRKMLLEIRKGLVNSKKIVPYMLVTSISFSAFSMFYSIPFLKDTRKESLWYKKEIDNNGNIYIEEQYQKIVSPSEISYISKWEEAPDGFYTRHIITYNVKALTEEEIENFVLQGDKSLIKVLGDPVLSKVEKRNNVSAEELAKEGYIRAIIYDESLDKYTYIEETASENNQSTIIWLLLVAFLNGIYAVYSSIVGNDKIRNQINELHEKYAPLDEESLTRKLEIRKDTLNRMK